MKITEWFARAVVAGLMRTSSDLKATYDGYNWIITDDQTGFEVDNDVVDSAEYIGDEIQLRKDGKDLYSLEWRKPTESDIGKMCWYYDEEFSSITLFDFSYTDLKGIEESGEEYLIADHGQIAPNEADFKRIYNGANNES
jgi:hypothetical protein